MKTEGQKNGEQKVPYVEGDAWSGITKREYFAAKIMQGLVNNNFSPTGFQNGDENELAKLAVKCSDALLSALVNER